MKLLIVDAQELIVTKELYHYEVFCSNIRKLIHAARQHGHEVIYIRHDDGVGAVLTMNQPGYVVFHGFAPASDEKIFDKHVNSPFKESGLLEYLQKTHETTLMIVGLQTDYCIDATIKCGFEHGFKLLVPANCNSTFDNSYMTAKQTYHYYNDFMWKGRYASCISFEEAIHQLEQCSLQSYIE